MDVETRTADLIDTGTIARIVEGTEFTWHDDGDALLEALESLENDDGPVWVSLDAIESEMASQAVVGDPNDYWDGGTVRKHRKKEMLGMAVSLLALLAGPAHLARRTFLRFAAWFWPALDRVMLAAYRPLGAGATWVCTGSNWSAIPWKALYMITRTIARYRVAQHKTSIGFTMRRKLAVSFSRVAFVGALCAALIGGSAVTTLLILGSLNTPVLLVAIGVTLAFVAGGAYLDTVAERADLHRFDLVVAQLSPDTWKRAEAASFRSAQILAGMHGPLSPRIYERGPDGALPNPRPAAPVAIEALRRMPAVVSSVYPAGWE